MTKTARSLKFNSVVYTPKPGEHKWEHPIQRGTPPPMKTIGPYDPSKDKRGIQLLKITKEDTDRIKRLGVQTGLPDKYINYNNPIAHKSYKQAQELANTLKIKYNVNATPVNPIDRAKENIAAYQSGSGIIKPVYSKGTYGVDTPGNWDPYGKDWIPGTPRGVQEEVEALERKNRKK